MPEGVKLEDVQLEVTVTIPVLGKVTTQKKYTDIPRDPFAP